MPTVKQKLVYIALTAIPLFLWTKFIRALLDYKRQKHEKVKEHHRHNCVVVYSKEDGMSGWPDYPGRLKRTLANYDKFLEPIRNFIETTEDQLDISMMILYHEKIIDSIANILKRNVRVRIILDARFDNNKSKMHRLIKQGAHVLYDAKFLNTDTIMHNKYAIKDYNILDGSGFTICGSMNWTQAAFSENYEFLVLSTNRQVVGALKRNFEESWEYMNKVKERNLLNDTMYQL